ncbi:MAG: PAS domain S-box protein [Desulfobacterales bacterium]|nr:PAS domain S-box protein [Desulfobacterales bacterium]
MAKALIEDDRFKTKKDSDQAEQTADDISSLAEQYRHDAVRFRTVFEAAPLGIVIADVQGYILEANHAFFQMLGYQHDQIKKMTFVDITHPEDRQETIDLSNTVRKGRIASYQIEKRYLKKDGQILWAIVRASAVKDQDGNIQYWLGIMEDISERKLAQEALMESEKQYRNILDSIEEGYFEVNLKGDFTFFNNRVCQIIGYEQDDLMGMNNRQYTSPETAREMYQTFNRVYRTGKAAKITKYDIIGKDGSKKTLEVSATLMRDADDQPVGFRGIMRDVTSRIQADKEKTRLESQVQHAQKMEAIGTLAGGIAHDFNNLLMGFQGNISLMKMDLTDDHPHQEFLNNMESYVKRGSDLTRQILGFARGGKYQVKTTNLNALINKNADMFSRARKEITIHKKFQDDLYTVDVDRGQIEQVLLNLFVNAWQAMPGGGNLYVETENINLQAHDYDKPYAIDSGKYVRVTISDTGIGMDKRTQERIFEPFFTTKAFGRGTGLGLASAYGIIKNHNGIINVYSEKGHGTTFKIYLPASDKQVIAENLKPEQARGGSETILLVDDEEMVADIGKDLLEKLGYTVLVAGGGAEAIKLFQRHRDQIHLVILDMIMPDMSGGETFSRIRAIRPNAKILLSSGYSLDSRASAIMKQGCNGFIQKPFNLKKISHKIREILDN